MTVMVAIRIAGTDHWYVSISRQPGAPSNTNSPVRAMCSRTQTDVQAALREFADPKDMAWTMESRRVLGHESVERHARLSSVDWLYEHHGDSEGWWVARVAQFHSPLVIMKLEAVVQRTDVGARNLAKWLQATAPSGGGGVEL